MISSTEQALILKICVGKTEAKNAVLKCWRKNNGVNCNENLLATAVMKTYIWELGEWNLVLSFTMAVIVYCFVIGSELLLTRTRSSTSSTSSSVAWKWIETNYTGQTIVRQSSKCVPLLSIQTWHSQQQTIVICYSKHVLQPTVTVGCWLTDTRTYGLNVLKQWDGISYL